MEVPWTAPWPHGGPYGGPHGMEGPMEGQMDMEDPMEGPIAPWRALLLEGPTGGLHGGIGVYAKNKVFIFFDYSLCLINYSP